MLTLILVEIKVERKSISGNIFFLNKAPISWYSKKQIVVALSSCEAEYIALSNWLRGLLTELKIFEESAVQLRMGNTSVINLARNTVSHGRSKHIEVKYHFLRDMVNKGRVELTYCKTDFQLADLLYTHLVIYVAFWCIQ